MIKRRNIFNKTHWIGERNDEVKFVKRLSFASAMYLELQNKFGKSKAFRIMREILIPIGREEMWNYLKSLDLKHKSPMDKLIVFSNLMDEKDVLKFNKREYVKKDVGIYQNI